MILLCYDGSEEARTAITAAGRMFDGQEATVLTVWEPFARLVGRASLGGLGMVGGVVDAGTDEDPGRLMAQRSAGEGAELARVAGLDARPDICAQQGRIVEAILAVGEELDVEVIVVGSHGVGAVKSILLGSVSEELLHQADRPVLVVPSQKVCAERSAHLGAAVVRVADERGTAGRLDPILAPEPADAAAGGPGACGTPLVASPSQPFPRSGRRSMGC